MPASTSSPTAVLPALTAMPQPLPDGYYLRNFETVLATVSSQYSDLLDADEQAFIERFEGLGQAPRRLYVRLISRKGPCFRRDLLQYPEIADLDAALAELAATAFTDRGDDEPISGQLALLRRPELLELRRSLTPNATSTGRKAAWIEDLCLTYDIERLAGVVRERIEIVRPRGVSVVLRLRLLFFGNLRQDWSAFVLRDLGVARHESYALDRADRVFPCRRAFEDALTLRLLRDQVHHLLHHDALDDALRLAAPVGDPSRRWHPSVQRLADGITNRIGRALERVERWSEALSWYARATTPPARERRTRVLVGLGRNADALRLIEAIAADPRDETERVFARRFGHRLRRRLGIARSLKQRQPRPRRELTLPRAGSDVEQCTLEHLAGQGRDGFFAQNWLWRSLFGLAFWDVVFAPVSGAFAHPFQYGPLDLHQATFRRARADAVAARLEEIASRVSAAAEVLETYDAKHGTANALVSWHDGGREALALALSRLSGAHLSWVFDRLSRDLGRYRRGFPDLFVSRDEPPGFVLYEVKAPGDQLRAEQRGWLDYLNEGGLPAFELRVRWADQAS